MTKLLNLKKTLKFILLLLLRKSCGIENKLTKVCIAGRRSSKVYVLVSFVDCLLNCFCTYFNFVYSDRNEKLQKSLATKSINQLTISKDMRCIV